MILKSNNALALTAFIVVVALSWAHGNYTGRQATKHKFAKKALTLQTKLDVLKQKSNEEIKAKTIELIRQEAISNERIEKLINENKKLASWWKTSVPADAINHAFGVR